MTTPESEPPSHRFWCARVAEAKEFGGATVAIDDVRHLLNGLAHSVTRVVDAEYQAVDACVDALRLLVHAARPNPCLVLPHELLNWAVEQYHYPSDNELLPAPYAPNAEVVPILQNAPTETLSETA